ncbi:MAG TPA: uroporphyrinogen-III synthase [Rhodoblastus sp.]|nr:uroporphyrinogen-III synthase [Rhodoblastus sp.]
MKVLIVRAAQDARRTAARLAAAGRQAIVAPVLDIANLDFAPPVGVFDAILATSAHAFEKVDSLAPFRAVPLFVVGARTAEAARAAGFPAPQMVVANAGELGAVAARDLPRGACVLYIAGRDRKPDLEAALSPFFALTIVETYAAEPVAALPVAAAEALGSGDVAVLHYSQRSAAIFLDLAGRAGFAAELGAARHIAISADAAKPLLAAGLPVAVAAEPNEDSLIEELARIAADADRAGDA